MPILPVVFYGVAILAALIGVAAMPAVVIQREGGMGIGSALIVAQAAQLATLVLGAGAAAFLVDRARAPYAVGAASALLAIAFVMVAIPPPGHHEHVSLPSQVFAHALAGCGLGLLLTTGFAAAAAISAPLRPVGIAVLLLAAPAARATAGIVDIGSGQTLVVAAVVVVAPPVLALALAAALSRAETLRADAPPHSRLSAGGAALGGLLAPVGVFMAIAGADASQVTVATLAAPFGVTMPEVLSGLSNGLLLAGLLIVLGGALVLGIHRRFDPATVAVAGTVLLVAVAASGTVAAASFAAPAEAFLPGERSLSPIGLAPIAGAATGIATAGVWLTRGGRSRVVAATGSVILAGSALAATVALLARVEPLLEPGPLVALLAGIGLGGGLTAGALRAALADVPWHQRGIAAALGVAAGGFGTALGSAIGNGAGVATLTGQAGAQAIGLLILAAAALAAVGLMTLVRPAA